MHASDYKKLGSKLKELVPCVLLSFDDEQILMWRGPDWISMYQAAPSPSEPADVDILSSTERGQDNDNSCKPDAKTVITSPKMMSLWKRSIDSNKALLLDEIDLDPDALLKKVEEFEGVSQATEHSYPALILSSEDGTSSSIQESEVPQSDPYSGEYEVYSNKDDYDYSDDSDDDAFYDSDSVPLRSLPVDVIAEKLDHD